MARFCTIKTTVAILLTRWFIGLFAQYLLKRKCSAFSLKTQVGVLSMCMVSEFALCSQDTLSIKCRDYMILLLLLFYLPTIVRYTFASINPCPFSAMHWSTFESSLSTFLKNNLLPETITFGSGIRSNRLKVHDYFGWFKYKQNKAV